MNVQNFLKLNSPLILDGGFATELQRVHNKELSSHLWSAAYLVKDPQAIHDVHLSYLRAGVDIITTCSYQATISGFMQCGFSNDQAISFMQKSVSLATEARDQFWTEYQKQSNDISRIKPLIALSFGPFGATLLNGSEYSGDYGPDITISHLKDFHRERIKIFYPKLADIDLIAFETIPSFQEVDAICSVLREEKFSVPCWISFSCKNDSLNCHGETLIESIKLCCTIDSIVAIGINCTKPKYAENLVNFIRNEMDLLGDTDRFIVCYPDAGCEWDESKKDWDSNTGLSAEEFGNCAILWAKRSRFKIIIGGCCKTTPEYTSNVRERVFEHLEKFADKL
ncbi:homocysteine methyltransferase [Gigaspora rosea]|uniref:Homocysteine methyltransferase n=1 Tax=Gigaspora rosea TaxID=44941 RepID=A0A397V9R4_9GLOM|nr:homocysteine methyltransferase [Gigaspora rosea]